MKMKSLESHKLGYTIAIIIINQAKVQLFSFVLNTAGELTLLIIRSLSTFFM